MPQGVVLLDTACGDANWLGMELRELGLDYAVSVLLPTRVWKPDRFEGIQGDAVSADSASPRRKTQNHPLRDAACTPASLTR